MHNRATIALHASDKHVPSSSRYTRAIFNICSMNKMFVLKCYV